MPRPSTGISLSSLGKEWRKLAFLDEGRAHAGVWLEHKQQGGTGMS